jgi:hypothetical protein
MVWAMNKKPASLKTSNVGVSKLSIEKKSNLTLAEEQAVLKKLVQVEEEKRVYRENNLCFFFHPYKWQSRLREMIVSKNITVCPAPNKIGKTMFMANVAISWALGFDPWNEVPEGTDGAVLYRRKWYRHSSLGIKPPVRLRITGEDWKHHLGQTIVPELKKWAPAGTYETKKNEQGIEYLWTFENGSTFELLTHTQEYDISESWMGDGWLPDEPPPQRMYGAMSRGIFLRGGKVVMSTVPLKEAWMLDELVLSGRSDIGVIDDLLITDNEDLYKDEVARLINIGLPGTQIEHYFDLLLWEDKERGIFVKDKGRKARIFIHSIAADGKKDEVDNLKLLRFVQDTDPSEAASRFGGRFKSLEGRVLKNWDKDKHFIEPFPVPLDWPVICMIDFHLVKPHAISYHAVNPQGIKFIIKERWENLTPEETADTIIRDIAQNVWRCDEVYIDPLSKGDTAYMKNRAGSDLQDSFSIIESRLADHNIMLDVASKDKESGIRNIEAALSGPNRLATYYVFNTCPRHLHEALRWVYEDNKPNKKDDDFMENWYRATLTGLHYEPMRPKSLVYHDHGVKGESAWMGN